MQLSKFLLALMVIAMIVVGFSMGRFKGASASFEEVRDELAKPISKERGKSKAGSSGRLRLLPHISEEEIKMRLSTEFSKVKYQRNHALVNILFNEWLQRAPFEALEFASENQLEDFLLEGLKVAGGDDPDRALSWIKGYSNDLFRRAELAGKVYEGLASIYPQSAISRIEKIDNEKLRRRYLLPVLNVWATQDIDRAFSWLKHQETNELTADAYGNLMTRYIEQRPQESLELISSMNENAGKVHFASQAAFHLVAQNPDEALKWAESLEGQTKEFALMGLMEGWSQSSGKKEALEYVKALPEGRWNDELFTVASVKISQGEPELLAEELTFLREDQQVIVARQLAQVYSFHDPEKTKSWIGSLPEGRVRDTAIRTSLPSFQNSDIEEAFRLSETLNDDGLRQSEIQKTLETWIPTDPQAAYQALRNTANLTDTQKETIIATLARSQEHAPDFLLPALSK